jgi:hypothetical protein
LHGFASGQDAPLRATCAHEPDPAVDQQARDRAPDDAFALAQHAVDPDSLAPLCWTMRTSWNPAISGMSS